jgi:Transglycosylase SLT domain
MAGKGPAYAAIGVGALFIYSGIKGYSILKTVQNVVKGGSPNTGQSTADVSASANNETQNASIINTATGNTTAVTGSAAANQAIAKPLAAALGWTEANGQWQDLVQLWDDESGWSNTAENASGAYGVAQALPNTKYPKAGQPPSEGGNADATTQIEWGLSYIQSTYGNPQNALAHENAYNWY